MDALWNNLPWLMTMAVLVACSAFFSASEAALFSLRGPDRRLMEEGTRTEQIAERLLHNPDRLLSAVLFWNLVVNIAYFAIAAIVGTRWDSNPSVRLVFAICSLLTIIFFSEMLPKSLAVLQARPLARQVGIPLSLAVRLVDPIMPVLRTINLLSRRLIWPGLKEQPYLEISDLERAIELSTSDADLVEQEKTVLRNIVQLSELRVQEWMRPRKKFQTFRPPISIHDLQGKLTASGYLLVTDSEGDEIASALALRELSDVNPDHLEWQARPVTYIPWCATVGDALQEMRREAAEVAAVVNELGETIGIVTLTDMFDAVLTETPERGERLLTRNPMLEVQPGVWHVAGMTNLRRLSRQFDVELPASPSVTIGGVVQETLERLPESGDTLEWGPFQVHVLDVSAEGELLLRMVIPDRERQST